ncbi:MAG: CDP-alcohol phosphatidyltransferase family protein [Nanoarchaeota archaeon]
MNITNFIALFHIAIIPFIIYFIYKESLLFSFLAILLLFISVLIDFFEKLFIKKKAVESFFHPFSDKIVVLTLLFVFVLRNSFPAVIFAIFLLRDIIIGYIRMVAARDDVVIRGEMYGKVITSFQFVVVFTLLIKDFLFYDNLIDLIFLANTMVFLFTLIALILAIVSIIHYSLVYGKGLHNRIKLGKEIKREKIIILANEKAGGYRDAYRRHLLRRFALRRNAPVFYLSGKDIFAGMDKKVKSAEQFIIAGGDGTFEGALNYKPLQKKSLGFFPLGAGNSFYSSFYKGKRFEYLRSRFPFREILLDVLQLEWENGKIQTLFIGIGVDAEVTRVNQKKENHTLFGYIEACFKIARGPRIKYDLECTVDSRKYHWDNCVNLIIGKVPYIGYGIRSLLGTMKDDDGNILGMALVNTHSPAFNKALRLWALVLTQMGLAKSPLLPLKGKEFLVRSEQPFPIQAGGEFLGYSKWCRIKVVRKQKVLMI